MISELRIVNIGDGNQQLQARECSAVVDESGAWCGTEEGGWYAVPVETAGANTESREVENQSREPGSQSREGKVNIENYVIDQVEDVYAGGSVERLQYEHGRTLSAFARLVALLHEKGVIVDEEVVLVMHGYRAPLPELPS